MHPSQSCNLNSRLPQVAHAHFCCRHESGVCLNVTTFLPFLTCKLRRHSLHMPISSSQLVQILCLGFEGCCVWQCSHQFPVICPHQLQRGIIVSQNMCCSISPQSFCFCTSIILSIRFVHGSCFSATTFPLQDDFSISLCSCRVGMVNT